MTHKEISRKGGKSTSPAKLAAVRMNWKKAMASGKLGRPKKGTTDFARAAVEEGHPSQR